MAAKDPYDNKGYVKSIPVIMKGHHGWVEYNPAGICLQISGRPEISLGSDIMKEIFVDQPGEPGELKTLYALLTSSPGEVALANRIRFAEPAASFPVTTGEEKIAAMEAEIAALKAEIAALKERL